LLIQLSGQPKANSEVASRSCPADREWRARRWDYHRVGSRRFSWWGGPAVIRRVPSQELMILGYWRDVAPYSLWSKLRKGVRSSIKIPEKRSVVLPFRNEEYPNAGIADISRMPDPRASGRWIRKLQKPSFGKKMQRKPRETSKKRGSSLRARRAEKSNPLKDRISRVSRACSS